MNFICVSVFEIKASPAGAGRNHKMMTRRFGDATRKRIGALSSLIQAEKAASQNREPRAPPDGSGVACAIFVE
jgi:hypothetical protein